MPAGHAVTASSFRPCSLVPTPLGGLAGLVTGIDSLAGRVSAAPYASLTSWHPARIPGPAERTPRELPLRRVALCAAGGRRTHMAELCGRFGEARRRC